MIADVLTIVDVFVCTAIALRLMLFCKVDKKHKIEASWIAAVLIIFYGNVTLLWLFSYYTSSWPIMLVNLFVGIIVFAFRGNVVKILSFINRRKTT